LFAALLLADKLNDLAGAAADISSSQTTNVSINQATETLERLADRLENLALRLEN
jgi:hypothetical protein